jgi:molybdate transport system substrate-binding protein
MRAVAEAISTKLARWSGIAILAMGLSVTHARAAELTVFAAASLKDALSAVDASFEADTGKRVVAVFAASSALARQIEAGAPADVFISADQAWMDRLAAARLIKPDSRIDLLGNQLVVVAAKDSGLQLDIKPGFDLAGALGGGRLAIGDVKSVPAGRYARAALTKLGVFEAVSTRLAESENVRAALALVARGEAPLGIVYLTDVRVESGVEVVGRFPADSHPPIVYLAAIVASATHADAKAYLAFLQGDKAKAIFEAAGFSHLVTAP